MSEPHKIGEPNFLDLYRENQRLRAQIEHLKSGGCHVAKPGEMTFECSVHDDDKGCLACRVRSLRESVDEHGRCSANYKRLRRDAVLGRVDKRQMNNISDKLNEATRNLIKCAYAIFGWNYE